MKRVLSLVLIMVIVFTMVSCGKSIVGVWEDEYGDQVEFTKDEILVDGMTMEYEIDGDEIIMTFMGEEQRVNFKVDGDELRLYDDDIDESETLKRVK